MWDFPLVNVASAMKFSGTTIQEARIAVGAVAARPLRLTAVEAAIAGKPRSEETAASWPGDRRATPLRYNGYEIPLMRNLVNRAIRGHWRAGYDISKAVFTAPMSGRPLLVGVDQRGTGQNMAYMQKIREFFSGDATPQASRGRCHSRGDRAAPPGTESTV